MKRLTREDWKDPGSKMWEKVMDFGLPVEKEKAIIEEPKKEEKNVNCHKYFIENCVFTNSLIQYS